MLIFDVWQCIVCWKTFFGNATMNELKDLLKDILLVSGQKVMIYQTHTPSPLQAKQYLYVKHSSCQLVV